MARFRRDIRNHKSDKNGSAIQCLLVVKLTAYILELTDRRLAHAPGAAVGEIEAPLVRLGIVETQAQALEVTCRAVGFELQQIGAAIPDLADDRSALIFDPGSGATQGLQQPR